MAVGVCYNAQNRAYIKNLCIFLKSYIVFCGFISYAYLIWILG